MALAFPSGAFYVISRSNIQLEKGTVLYCIIGMKRNPLLQVLKNSSKLVMGIGAVLIIIGFMIMGQFVNLASLIRWK